MKNNFILEFGNKMYTPCVLIEYSMELIMNFISHVRCGAHKECAYLKD